jgi:hypothetical protein
VGRRTFSEHEAATIRALLREKERGDRSEQKRARHRLRQLGFYISDFHRLNSGFRTSDFEDLVRSGTIQISMRP